MSHFLALPRLSGQGARRRAVLVTLCTSLGGICLLLGGRSLLGQDVRTLRGRVTDAESGRSLPNAEILLNRGTLGIARTDRDGVWHLTVSRVDAVRLRVRHPGYAYRDIDLINDTAWTAPLLTPLTVLAIPLDAIIVTAARREQRLADAVVETELIGAREIERSGGSDVAAVLTERSGMQVDGGVPSGAGVQMRGFDSRRVLVLLDGMPMVGRVNGNFDLSRIPSSMVQRVEIVKGPQSTLYGSEALGGVINIISKRATEPGLDVGLSSTAGTQGRRDLAGSAGWRRGAIGGTLDAGVRRLDLAPGVSTDDATFANRWNGATSFRWQRDTSTQLELSALAIGEAQRYRTGQLYHFANNAQYGARASAQLALGGGRLTTTVHLSSFDHLSRASTLTRPVSDSGSRDAQRLAQGDVLYNVRRGSTWIDGGVQVRHEGITADRLDTRSPNVTSVEPFAQATLTLGALHLTPGLRVTATDRWGSFVAPRMAAMWRPVERVAVRASLGRGFRAPDFKELYLDFVNSAAGYAVRGNPDLRPEVSTSGSLGAEWTGARLWARGSLYRNDYRNFIETREPDAQGLYTYANIARGRTAGVEVEGGLTLDRWNLEGSYDFLRARDLDSDARLLGRPSHAARASATGPIGLGARGTVAWLYTGRTPLDRSANGLLTRERDGWVRMDARLTRPLLPGTEWSVGVTNLLGRRLLDAWPGFTGRQLFAGVRWQASRR